jgi:hypothetical protein
LFVMLSASAFFEVAAHVVDDCMATMFAPSRGAGDRRHLQVVRAFVPAVKKPTGLRRRGSAASRNRHPVAEHVADVGAGG